MFSGLDLNKLVMMIVPLLFAVTIHEVAHGWVAYRLGDSTAKWAGRLTLNPLKHLDPMGSFFPSTDVVFLQVSPAIRLRQAGSGELQKSQKLQKRFDSGVLGRCDRQPHACLCLRPCSSVGRSNRILMDTFAIKTCDFGSVPHVNL